MNPIDVPQHVLDLVIGHNKEQIQLSIPLSLTYIIIRYFFVLVRQILFCIKFDDVVSYGGGSVTSISSTIFIQNDNKDKYCKLFLKIGKDLEIEILLFDSKIKAFGETHSIQSIVGDPWKFTTGTGSEKYVQDIKIIMRLNRKTSCNCKNSDGSLELYFRNCKNNDKICAWTDDGFVSWIESDGFVKLKLKDDVDWNSNEEVPFTTYNIDKTELLENSSICLACGEYGFARQCCYWAQYEFYPEIQKDEDTD